MHVCKKEAEPHNTMRLNVWCSVSVAQSLMASPPLGPPEPPYTMRLNVWYSLSVAAKPYGQSAPGTTLAPLYYEVKCVVFCVSCSKALWPVRPWDHLSFPIL